MPGRGRRSLWLTQKVLLQIVQAELFRTFELLVARGLYTGACVPLRDLGSILLPHTNAPALFQERIIKTFPHGVQRVLIELVVGRGIHRSNRLEVAAEEHLILFSDANFAHL